MATGTGIDSSGWSPSLTQNPESYGTPHPVATHRVAAFGTREDSTFIPKIPAPPSPSVGGQVGAASIGWSTGLREPLAFRQRFRGQTLVVPQVKMHGAYGPVGQSARQQRLDNGVNDLYAGDYLPSSSAIAASFVGMGRGSALQRELTRDDRTNG